jgi:YfiH family protein
MIRPLGFRGAAFGTAEDGDGRSDATARAPISAELGISTDWAFTKQVHGAAIVEANMAGLQGEADALYTTKPNLPLCVATADCVPIVLEAADSVALVHAGWRGMVAEVVAATVADMAGRGDSALRAAIGPAIGPCCYEVGDDVLGDLGRFRAETTWGTPSVDLRAAAVAQLGEIEVWVSDRCTRTDDAFHSFRADGTRQRQVAVGWLPIS